MISEAFADRLLAADHFTCGQLKKDLLAYRLPLSFPLAARFDYRVKGRFDGAGTGYNVAGWVEGSDPRLRGEVVILGAHFDGCGEHMGLLFPGANDNGSGSSVVMGAAKAAARLGWKPRRSLLFVLFGGEEKGLQGSTWFAGHLPKPFTKVAAMFNFDMEGEGDKAGAAISALPETLKTAILKADEKTATLVQTRVLDPPGVRGSDFAPFFLQGVPCASFWSNGPHIEYHTPGDTIYRINPDILADIARLAFRSACLFADL
jgi:Zn-dependent M28 family amino/carboxypeptidase